MSSKQTEYNKRYEEKYPWAKTYIHISSRTSSKNHHYYKKGIKNNLLTKDVKFLWFRDKAYLMKQPSVHRLNPNENYTLENCEYIEYKDHQNLPRQSTKIYGWLKIKYPKIMSEFNNEFKKAKEA